MLAKIARGLREAEQVGEGLGLYAYVGIDYSRLQRRVIRLVR